ncbi:FCD domain-containing protein [Sphingomonas sp. MG17]|uniref:FCD domain-containing protein n=1 Tax=Sphingomonas tagetis TaxID=2949092 RepID=A0A9X2HNU4_9SPHN|nr:FCD domain-containing protein [Sphingomonas tagetis]MCP3731044.1 FCD domain-containing protein [Sphingomonas tagetis]
MSASKGNKLQFGLAQQIINLARVEGWSIGHRLTERALAEHFQVSRSPVRLALDLLVQRDVVARTESGRYELTVGPEQLDERPIGLPMGEVELLHDRILRDRFADELPAQVTETDLLRRYQTTRGTLMKVMLRLSNEGMVDRSQGHGWIFRRILNTVEAHIASYQMRMAIEPQAMRLPSFRIDRDRVQRMLDTHLRLRDSGESVDSTQEFELDAELHEAIVSFSGNEFFIEAIQRQNQLRRVAEYQLYYSDERMQSSHDGHIQILEALMEGDVELSAILMTKHLYMASRLVGIFEHESGKGLGPETAAP